MRDHDRVIEGLGAELVKDFPLQLFEVALIEHYGLVALEKGDLYEIEDLVVPIITRLWH